MIFKYNSFIYQKIKSLYQIIVILIFLSFSLFINFKFKSKDRKGESITDNEKIKLFISGNENEKNSFKKCYIPLDYKDIRIMHLIITRFIMELNKYNEFTKDIYSKEFMMNGFRVMEKYLLPSLESQSCNDFIWVLLIGNKANITLIETNFNFNISFKYKIIYKKEFQNYVRNISKSYDVLITTRYDYDDRIYYDAVNDIRKTININKPILLHGYNRGVLYFESNRKYYEFYQANQTNGALGLFLSLIIFIDKVNNLYTILDIGNHWQSRKILLEKYKLYGIKRLNYDPAVFDNGAEKFVYVRQSYSHSYNYYLKRIKTLKEQNFNLKDFLAK